MAKPGKWRLRAAQVIDAVLAECPPNASLQEKRRRVRAAYPFGERSMFPYAAWCKEVQSRLGKSRPGRPVGGDPAQIPLLEIDNG